MNHSQNFFIFRSLLQFSKRHEVSGSFDYTESPYLEWYLMQDIEGLCVTMQLALCLAGQQGRCDFSTGGASWELLIMTACWFVLIHVSWKWLFSCYYRLLTYLLFFHWSWIFAKCTVGALVALVQGFLVSGGARSVCRLQGSFKSCQTQSLLTCTLMLKQQQIIALILLLFIFN